MTIKGLVICDYPFPVGMAASNRILAYSEGLAANGVMLDVLTKTPYKSENGSQSLDGHRTVYYSSHYSGSATFFKRNLWDLRFRNLRFLYFIWKLGSRKEVCFILISFDNTFLIWFVLPILLLNNKPMGFVSDEFPPSIRARKDEITHFEYYTYKLFHSFLKFRILMSSALSNYYSGLFSKKPDNLILNTIVSSGFIEECEKHTVTDESFFDSKLNLVYMGNMELAKDNVDNIVRAMSLLIIEFPRIQLHLYGQANTDDCVYLENLITKLGLLENVFLKGKVSRDRVPEILCKANLLVSSQPNSFRAQGGFPTKLGEYWSSSRPVLFTNVGELSYFVKDGKNGFLVSPDSPLDYARKVKYILTNSRLGDLVGKNGYKELKSNFVSERATEQLALYLKSKYNKSCKND